MNAPVSVARPSHVEISLATGTLKLDIARADWPIERLCDFALRRNPRRAFLIVSKVLGRHIPARPSEMRAAMRDLAEQAPHDLPGPVLTIGMAETAVALGQGVHEELARRPGFDGLYLHSTRQQLDHPLLCRFEEPHSHASAHLLYRPASIDLAAMRTLVLVDDEVSTGTTLANLVAALLAELPRIEHVVIASLTDWSGEGAWLSRIPRPTTRINLLEGQLRWEPSAAPEALPAGVPPGSLGRMESHTNFGRLGLADPGAIPLPDLDLPADTPLRIVGTGEFTYPPFLLAERLERDDHDVVVQATSRSPVLLGGAIKSALAFADNYATAVPNFLYNADRTDGRLTVICHETRLDSVDPALLDALDARALYFGT
jgi:hypothetical protein